MLSTMSKHWNLVTRGVLGHPGGGDSVGMGRRQRAQAKQARLDGHRRLDERVRQRTAHGVRVDYARVRQRLAG